MDIRTVISDASTWKFDLERMMYVRFPNDENPGNDSAIRYSDKWEPFIQVCRNGMYLMVVRPVPWGTGQWRETGRLISDTHSTLPYPENDPYPEPHFGDWP